MTRFNSAFVTIGPVLVCTGLLVFLLTNFGQVRVQRLESTGVPDDYVETVATAGVSPYKDGFASGSGNHSTGRIRIPVNIDSQRVLRSIMAG